MPPKKSGEVSPATGKKNFLNCHYDNDCYLIFRCSLLVKKAG